MSENRSTVLVRIERSLRDQLAATAGPLYEHWKDGPKESIGHVIQRLVEKADSVRIKSVNRRRRRRR